MDCYICKHEHRQEIDEALLARNWGEPNATLDIICNKFKLPLGALQQHAVLHFQAPTMEPMQSASITDKVKFKEADLLREMANEYYYTLKNLGQKLNAIIAGEPLGLKIIQPALVELYLGAGKAVRDTVDSLLRMDAAINGEQDKGLGALADLVGAINNSKTPPVVPDYPVESAELVDYTAPSSTAV